MAITTNIVNSGLRAASLRISTSANNVANIESTSTPKNTGPYIPQDVVQISQEIGGTYAYVKDSGKRPISVFEPDHPDADSGGIVKKPNIAPAEELIKSQQASVSYRANLKVAEVYSDTQKVLLDIFV